MDGPYTTLYLIRHAQSRPTGRLDEPDWPLSELGVEQAKHLPPLLEPLGIQRIVSSPYIRCLNTIRPFADQFNIDIEIREGLRERRITVQLREDFEDVMPWAVRLIRSSGTIPVRGSRSLHTATQSACT